MKKETQRQKEHKAEMNGVTPGDDAILIQKRIALRAYELYLRRGGVGGHPEEDWLQAEQEILSEQKG